MKNTTKLAIAGTGILAVLAGGGAFTAASAAAPASPTAATGVATALSTSLATSMSATGSATISRQRAIAIAKQRVPGGQVSKVESEWEHGYRTWKIELRKGHWEYKVYVSVRSGKIIKFDRKYDD